MTQQVCPVCGVGHVACGADPAWSGTPVDVPPQPVRRPVVADLSLYEVPVRGHVTTMKLSDEDAKSIYGDAAKKVGSVKKAEPQPVTRPPYDTGEVKDPADQKADEPEVKKAPAPQNKARKA